MDEEAANERRVSAADDVLARLKPVLYGQSPDVIGIVLAEAVALYLAGHNPQIRSDIRRVLFESIDKLTDIAAGVFWAGLLNETPPDPTTTTNKRH